jgi:hypothetical protein
MAEPLAIRTITKLDQNSMVWAYEGAATEEAVGPFLALLLLAMSPVIFWLSHEFFFEFLYDSAEIQQIIFAALVFAGGVFVIGLAIYLLKISLFSRYGDLHFNRKTGKIYSRKNNFSLQMDWKHVRPFAARGIGPVQLGGQPVMSLILAELHPTQPNILKTRMIVAGLLPNRHGISGWAYECHLLWLRFARLS